jgi:hypothetical protein
VAQIGERGEARWGGRFVDVELQERVRRADDAAAEAAAIRAEQPGLPAPSAVALRRLCQTATVEKFEQNSVGPPRPPTRLPARPPARWGLICTAALWVYPLAAHRSFFVCARKLA